MLTRAIFLCACMVAAEPAKCWAVVVASGADNDTAPSPDPGFANIGQAFNGNDRVGSAVYIGNRWLLTANHVIPTRVVLGGVSYNLFSAFTQQIGTADLKLIRLQTNPGLPTLQLTAAKRMIGEHVIYIATGDCFIEDNNDGTFDVGNPGTTRWGENEILGFAAPDAFTKSILTKFDESGLSHEAQVALWDSGGAAFVDGQLAGVIWGRDLSTTQFGAESYSADLSQYRPQIVAITGTTNLLGDTNADGEVDQDDLDNVLADAGKTYYPQGDANGDHVVDIADYNIFNAEFGTDLRAEGDVNSNGTIDTNDLEIITDNDGMAGLGLAGGDLNNDGFVTVIDWNIAFGNFGTTLQADFDNNGYVDIGDYTIFDANFGETIQFLIGDTNGDGIVDEVDLDNVLNNWTSMDPPELP
jgi:hypothetical protein